MNIQPPQAGFPQHPLWDFSLKVYAQKGVSQACLVLQEEFGVDVNLLLFFCWTAAGGAVRLGEERIVKAVAIVESWHREIVRPLRDLRRRLKQGFDGISADYSQILRRMIQKIELDAEHIEQLSLAASLSVSLDAVPNVSDQVVEAADNLVKYLTALCVDKNDIPQQHLAVILAACFPELPKTDIDGSFCAQEPS